ncbi:MAG: hypothetical protein IJ711_13120 [Lachnospiraceae bacterium]|nr:hypothetical protein [Lachnospiraceae bacterium]
MDKYEYRIRAEEINALIEKKQFMEAVKIADTIDWSRVKSVMMLCKVSELYKYVRRFEDAKEILLLAYDRQPGGRKIVYSLCELCIKLEETVQAVEYYKEFVQVAPTDTRRFILQYRLYEAQDVSLEERIAVLEEYKKRDYREKWAYELAYLYHRIGLATRCVEECDELILWFGEGKYVNMAMELKMLHQPLSPSQQEKYDRRFMKEEPQEEEVKPQEEENALPIEIKAVDVSKAKTAEIIPTAINRSLEEADTVEVPDIKSVVQTEESSAPPQPVDDVQPDEEVLTEAEEAQPEDEIPLREPDPDLDIQVKTVDVGEYNTINLQQELAQNLSRMFAEEDMEAADATMALPIETIIGTTTQNGKVIESISDDAIKNALLAPLLQDTGEITPITEEDLLASIEQERIAKEEAEQAEAERIAAEQAEAARIAAEQAEAERIAAEQAEAARIAAEQAEAERIAAEQAEAARVAAEQAEAARIAAEQAEAERVAAEQAEAERIAAEQAEAARIAAEQAEAERVAAEQAEAARIAAEQAEAERVAAEQAEAERVAAEQAEAARTAAQSAAAPVTAGAIMAAEIAHAVTTGNTDRLNIGTPRIDVGNLSTGGKMAEGEPIVDEQITGQLSLLDIMNEWEETKRANEEKHIAEMREKVMKQTGPMFSNFDEVARASVTADLDLINPAVDVFKDTGPGQGKVQEVSETEDFSDLEKETERPDSSQKESPAAADPDASVPKKVLNTEEINGLEEKLIETLAKTEEEQRKEEEIPAFIPDIDFEHLEDVPVKEEAPPREERMIIAEEAETKGASLLAAMVGSKQETASEDESVKEPAAKSIDSVPEAVVAEVKTEQAVPESLSAAEAAAEEPIAPELSADAEPVTEAEAPPEPVSPQPSADAPSEMPEPASSGYTPQSAREAVEWAKSASKPSAEPAAADAEPVSQPADEQSAESSQSVTSQATAPPQPDIGQTEPEPQPEARFFTKEEKELFGNIAPTKELQEKVTGALDQMSMTPKDGNGVVVGENGIDRVIVAENMVKHMQRSYPQFSGKVMRFTGEELASRNMTETLQNLENGALIIEKAGGMEPDIQGNLVYQLEKLGLKGILVVLEDTKEEIERLMLTYPQMEQMFTSRIEVEVLDNDGLVGFAKAYANTREYSIDEMGVLAVYTRISDLQTNEHAVTVEEVKNMVNEAIDRAEKKNVKHFVDVLIGKRFDDEDMVILREKDFSIE